MIVFNFLSTRLTGIAFIFLDLKVFSDEIEMWSGLPIGENFSELVGPKRVRVGIPVDEIKCPHPVSLLIPALQFFAILIVCMWS